MKAVVWKELGVLALEERPEPEIQKPTDAIVRVTLSSICSSDIHIKHGMMPKAVPGVTLGHEMVGEVVAVGAAVTKFQPGDRVAVNHGTFCGECFFCKRGYTNNCDMEDGGWALGCRVNGGQAEFLRVMQADNALYHIPDSVSDLQALLVGDVLSTGWWAAEIGEIQPADTVVVIGAGPTGLCTSMCAKLYSPATLVSIDVSDERLAFAKAHGLADITINPRKEDAVAIVRGLTEGRGADTVFEVAGGDNTFEMAWQMARCNGVVVLEAHYKEDPQQLPLKTMYGKNLIFKTGGVHAHACDKILKLIEKGVLDGVPLVTHQMKLEDAMQAYRLFEAQEDGVIKVALSNE